MLREVLARRFKGDEEIPQLLLLDGGKGQVSAVKDIVPESIVVMGISKGKHLKRKSQTVEDEYWILKGEEILSIDVQSPEILIDLRNEAHRFAISYFRKQSIKQSKKSVLDNIEGVGDKRKKELLKKFKSVEGIKKASYEDIYTVVKNKKVAENVTKYFTNPSHP